VRAREGFEGFEGGWNGGRVEGGGNYIWKLHIKLDRKVPYLKYPPPPVEGWRVAGGGLVRLGVGRLG
jgi:hypothetical protein